MESSDAFEFDVRLAKFHAQARQLELSVCPSPLASRAEDVTESPAGVDKTPANFGDSPRFQILAPHPVVNLVTMLPHS